MHPLRQHLLNVGAALQSDVIRARIMGDWDTPGSLPTVRIEPPATPAQLDTLKRDVGQPLPDTLIEVLRDVSADIEIRWVMNGRRVRAEGLSFTTIEIDVTAPPDLSYENGEPILISGGLRLSLDGIRSAYAGVPGWQSVYSSEEYTDTDQLNHEQLIRDFMGAGFPVMTTPNGDWVAIDQRSGDECVLHVSHEGESAGMEIDLTLIQFLTHLTWLGPVWPDYIEIYDFARSIVDVVPGDYRVHDVTFDAQSDRGTAWRNWFWQGTDLPDPDPSLLGRCGARPMS